MANQKDHRSKDSLDKCYKVVQQSGAEGIRAIEIAEKLGLNKTTVHRNLTSLDLRGKVESKGGRWFAKTEKQTTRPLEKEIVIELPIPKDQLQVTVVLELLAKEGELKNYPRIADIYRTILEKVRETRTIKIKGKNVDDLDLEKVQNLILQANNKGSKVNLKGFLKKLKRSRANNSQRE